MSKRWRAWIVSALYRTTILVLAMGSTPRLARACTPCVCRRGDFVLGDVDEVPANAPAIAWHVPHACLDSPSRRPELRLSKIGGDDGVPISISLEEVSDDLVWIRPSALEVGAQYRLQTSLAPFPENCTTDPAEFTVGAAIPLPASLGEVVVSDSRADHIPAASVNSRCYAPLRAIIADVTLHFTAQAEPWSKLLTYRALVDGKAWQPAIDRPLVGGEAVVFAACPGSETVDTTTQEHGLLPGEHTLRFEGQLPGGALMNTDDVTVRLDCPPAESEPGSQPYGGSMVCSMHTRTTQPSAMPLVYLTCVAAFVRRTSRKKRRRDESSKAQ